ncbi:MAG: hypothetical protein ABI759_30930, partial [Candidatus Solibacter sp.]
MVLLRYSLAVFVLMVGTAQASTILQWTFDGATNPADLSNSAASPNVSASTGTGTASGLHASALTDWTTPVGNGTTDAFSSTNWGGGDYYQFTFSTAGFINLSFAFDQTSSATGPKNFKVQTSTGSGYSDLGGGAYAVLLNGTPNPAWTSGTVQPAYHYSFALPGGTAGVRL